MSDIDLQKAFDLIATYENEGRFSGEKDDELITKAEAALGLAFPPTYRRFLKEYGCGGMAGEEFFGLIDDDFINSTVPDAIWLTLDERKTGLPESMIVIHAVGDGTYFVLDTDKKNDVGECPVVAWTPGLSSPGDEVEKIADDFGEFLLTSLQEALS